VKLHKNILIISPIFPPATGGAATYYKLLLDEFEKSKYVSKVILITEASPGLPIFTSFGKVILMRIFPARAGILSHGLKFYFRYIIQNFLYFFIPLICHYYRLNNIIIHSSFFNQPNLMRFVMPMIPSHVNRILDVRDKLLPERRKAILFKFDEIIACSSNVFEHLCELGLEANKITHIPILHLDLSDFVADNTVLDRYDLVDGGYFCYVGNIKIEKGLDRLKNVLCELRKLGATEPLIIVGQIKEHKCVTLFEQISNVHFVGALPRHISLSLMKFSKCNINLSYSEGLPRSSLETINLGAPCILPTNIPEFKESLPNFVMESENPAKVASQILHICSLENEKILESYPIENHFPENIVKFYLNKLI
jgi:glycosyltransferase involved in cell wall biosynthesis